MAEKENEYPDVQVSIFTDGDYDYENIKMLIDTLNEHRRIIINLVSAGSNNLDLTKALFSLLKKLGYKIEKESDKID